jgi:hypothetical protein
MKMDNLTEKEKLTLHVLKGLYLVYADRDKANIEVSVKFNNGKERKVIANYADVKRV